MLLTLIIASIIFIACITAAVRLRRPLYEIYTIRHEGKLRVGIKRKGAKQFPIEARKHLDPSYARFGGHWDVDKKHLRLALLDPESLEIDDEVAQAVADAKSLMKSWEGESDLDKLERQVKLLAKK